MAEDKMLGGILQAINRLFSDTSVSKSVTISRLKCIHEELEVLQEALGDEEDEDEDGE